MNVVCGVDFEEASMRAADVAAALARSLDATLLLVHSTESMSGFVASGSTKTFIGPPPRNSPPDAADLARRIELERDRLAAHGCAIEVVFEEGRTDEVLARVARERRAAVIAIGTHGLQGVTAERLVASSVVPVLAVRSNVSALARWFAAGATPLRILLPVELDDEGSNRRGMELAHDFLVAGPCEIHVLHVIASRVVPALGAFTTSIASLEQGSDLEKTAGEALTEVLVSHGLGDSQVHLHLERGAPEDEIADLAESLDADLVIVGHGPPAPGRLLTGSVAVDVLRRVERPILVVSRDAQLSLGRLVRRGVDLPAETASP